MLPELAHATQRSTGWRLLAPVLALSLLVFGSVSLQAAAAASGAGVEVVGCRSVERGGVVFAFDGQYPCGSFANGDPWVAPREAGREVVVVSVSPGATAGRHGLMVNPSSTREQGYDSRIGHYVAGSAAVLPLRARGGQSLVKAVSSAGGCGTGAGHAACLQAAVVLTVVDEPLAGGGGQFFRPPYFGSQKALRPVSGLRTDLLPDFSVPQGAPSLQWVRDRFAQVQLDHLSNWQGRYLHPIDSFGKSNYGSDLARDNNDAALRLLLAAEQPAVRLAGLVNFVQAGLDWAAVAASASAYPADGGHNVGRKVAVVFASVLLDDPALKQIAGRTAPGVFSEDDHVYLSSTNGRVLFGRVCTQGEYETVLNGGAGKRDCRDPSGQIDGGEIPGSVYQVCCTAKAYRSSSLVARLLPGAKQTWNNQAFHDYIDRWTSFGAWTSPDSQNRFPERHGTAKNGGMYSNAFQDTMWKTHHATPPPQR
jgi:hypothetical protein